MTFTPADVTALAGFDPRIAFLVFLRVGAAMFLLPGFGETMIPMRVRLALALALTLALVPLVATPADLPEGGGLLLRAGAETAIGLALGLAVRLVYVGLQVAGTMAAQATSLSQLLGAEGVDPQPALGAILMMAGLALAMSLGLGVRLVEAFALLFRSLPPGAPPPVAFFAEWAPQAVAASFRLAFLLAAPFLAVSLLYNLGLGVINKAMPQLMVAFVGAPAITLGALALTVLAAPVLLSVWAEALDKRLAAPFAE